MRERTDSAYFTVNIPIEVRPKLERLARGSRRSLGNTVAVLIEREDEADPMWNVASDPQEAPNADAIPEPR